VKNLPPNFFALERGLTNAKHSRIDASWIKARLVGCEFIVADCHPPALFDLVEEPFDHICEFGSDTGYGDRLAAHLNVSLSRSASAPLSGRRRHEPTGKAGWIDRKSGHWLSFQAISV
jgi:hypothetical protein